MSQKKKQHLTLCDDTSVKTLYVGVKCSKFPSYVTSKHLQQHFSEFEKQIENASIVRDLETNESKGYGFVKFSSHKATVDAFQKLNGTKLQGRFTLVLSYYADSNDSGEQHNSELYFRAMKSKLPDYINKRHIQHHFAEFKADIIRIVVAYDQKKHESKGFGFVQFSSAQAASKAKKKLHGSKLIGKFPLYINYRNSSKASSRVMSPTTHSSKDLNNSSTGDRFDTTSQSAKVESSLMVEQAFKLPDNEFKSLLCNLQKLKPRLKSKYSTSLSVNKQMNVVHLQAPASLERKLNGAKEEVMACISSLHTLVTVEHRFNDTVVGLVLSSMPEYLDIVKKEAAQQSVLINVQKHPKLGFQMQGTNKGVQTVKQKISTLAAEVESNITQSQMIIGMTDYLLVSTDMAFSKFYKQLQETEYLNISIPKQHGLLRQQLLQTSLRHIITLQICVSEMTEEDVDAIVVDPSQLALTCKSSVSRKFEQYYSQHGIPSCGYTETWHDCDPLQCRSVILAPIPTWTLKESRDTKKDNSELILSIYYNSLVSANAQNMSSVSFLLPGIQDKVPVSVSTLGIMVMLDTLCTTHPQTSIHTVRIIVNSELSASCVSTFDENNNNTFNHAKVNVAASSSVPLEISCSPPLVNSLQWQWCDDKKSYISYPSNISEKLTQIYLSSPSGKCFFTINANNYVVDLSTMTQKNLSTGFIRKVQFVKVEGASKSDSDNIQWYYMDDNQVFVPYSKLHSDLVEKMYSGTSQNKFIEIHQRQYEFDFSKMKQVNSSTRHSRRIQRKICPRRVSDKEFTQFIPIANSSINGKEFVITIRGQKENVSEAQRQIKMKLKELLFTTSVPLPALATIHLQQKLHVIIKKHTVDYRIKKEFDSGSQTSDKVLEIEGPEHLVNRVVTEVQAEIIKYHSETPSVYSAAIAYPPEWEPQTKTTELFEISRISTERQYVISMFQTTLSSAKIVSVKRIQNKWLWERYEHNKRRLEEKNAGRINEKLLFHGSRNSPAEVIYDSEEGFDMRFSSKGMWGQANYFAVNASYSNAYAYRTPSGCKEILLAKVLTGDSYACQPDSTIRMPPEKSATTSNKIQLKQVRYDTVNGETNGSQVFMTYSNDKAYPAYLISYSTTVPPQDKPRPQPQRPSASTGARVGVVQSAYLFFQQLFKK